jgi:hypothetical protein
MTPYEFVNGFRRNTLDDTIAGEINTLRSGPPGRRPHKSLVDRSRWFVGLSPAGQAMVEQVARAPLYRAALACLAVVDGEPRERTLDGSRSRLRLLARKHGQVAELTGHEPGLSRLLTDMLPPHIAYARRRPALVDTSSKHVFVALLRREAFEGAVEDSLAALEGRTTCADVPADQAHWFARLGASEQQMVERVMLSVAHGVVFSFCTTVDGLDAIEDDPVKTEFHLLHSNDAIEVELTHHGEFLHEVLGIIEGDD